jgi:hypothetical protein
VTNVHGVRIANTARLARPTGRGPWTLYKTFIFRSNRNNRYKGYSYAARDSCPLVLLSYTVNLPGSRQAPDFHLHPFRILFKTVLKIFYGTIVVEGVENIPQTGRPW